MTVAVDESGSEPSGLRLPGRMPGVPDSSLLLLGGLALVEAIVVLTILTGTAIYIVAAILGIGFIFVAVRRPKTLAYVALTWMLFEKGLGSHFGASLTNTISQAGDGLLLFALFQVTLVNLIRKRWPVLSLGPVGFGFVAILALSVLLTLRNEVPSHVAILGTISTVHALIIFFVIMNVGFTVREVERFALVGLIVMGLAGIIGVLQAVPHSPAWIVGGEHLRGSAGLMRVDGPFDHPISNGDYLAMSIPMAVTLFLFGNLPTNKRLLVGASGAVMCMALLLTFTREAWIAVPAGMIFLGIFVERRLFRIFAFAVAPVMLLVAIIVSPVAARIVETTHGNLRFKLLQLSWPMIQNHLWLGVGPGRFGGHVAYETHTPLYAQYHLSSYFYGTGNQIDMFWTHLLAESGVLGVAAFLGMIIACYWMGHQAYRAADEPRSRALILGFLWSVPVVVIVSLVSSTLEAGPGATLFWAEMGMMVVVCRSVLPRAIERTVPLPFGRKAKYVQVRRAA